jgi:two-component system nitrogen regulation response regulator NtrX
MIDVNCATLAEELVESELFGHERGALPAAPLKKQGKFELAGAGTLFFDEIGDMSLGSQGKLLRVLQAGEFQRVGGNRTLRFRARVIAATNKEIKREIEHGRFREDLYYRLNVIPIQVPALRQRLQDLPLLVEVFLQECAQQSRGRPKRIAPEALEVLSGYGWPGNVRELKNLVERLVIMTKGETIGLEQVPPPYRAQAVDPCHMANSGPPLEGSSLDDARRAFEYDFVQRSLALHGGDVEATARAIGVAPERVRGVISAGQGGR